MEKVKRIYTLDAIKLICTVLILFHHYMQVFPFETNGIKFFGGKFYFGFLVELFFILSGYFMGNKLEKAFSQGFCNFFMSKLIRLFPMCIISTVCYIGLRFIYVAFFDGDLGVEPYGLWSCICAILNLRGGGYRNTACFQTIHYGM